MTKMKKDNKNIKTLCRILIIVCALLFVAVSAFCIYVYSLLSRMHYNPEDEPSETLPGITEDPYDSATQAPTIDPETLATPEPEPTPQSNEDYGVINIMVFGVDNRYKNSYSGLSDVNIILTLDTVNKEVRIASVLRDTLIYIPSKEDFNHINSAIVHEGGPDGAVSAIESAFNIDIDHYMITSFRKVARIIDAVDGVRVNLTQSETWALNGLLQEMNLLYGYDREKDMLNRTGNVNLTGLQAVAYMRIRKIDSDNARADRQQEVLTNIREKLMNCDLKTFYNLMNVVTDCVKTDMEPPELLEVAKVLYDIRNGGFKATRVPFEGYYETGSYKGMFVFNIDFEKTNELLHDFVYEGKEP